MDQDGALLRRMDQGDEDAVEEFVRKYYPVILGYCRLHLPDPGEAEDLTQEVFVRFFRSLDRYRHRGKAANYLYTIAANGCRDVYRRPPPAPAEAREEPGADPIGPLEQRLDLRRALETLPPELRQVAELHYFQELPLPQVAKLLNIGLPLAKYRARRARERMKEELT